MRPVHCLAVLMLAAPLSAQKPAAPAPFGISPGMSLDRIMSMGGEMMTDGVWRIAKPPRPHVEFTMVSVYANRSAGACGVFAMSPATGSMSSLIETGFQLVTLYGIPTVNKLVESRATYPPPILRVKPDSLDSEWSRPTSKLPTGIHSIRLRPILTDDDKWYMSILYRFSNFNKCVGGFGGDAAGSLGP